MPTPAAPAAPAAEQRHTLPEPTNIPGVVSHLARGARKPLLRAHTHHLMTRILPRVGMMVGAAAIISVATLTAVTGDLLLAAVTAMISLAPAVPLCGLIIGTVVVIQARQIPTEPSRGHKRAYLSADGLVMLTMAERTRRGVTTWWGANHFKARGVTTATTSAFRQDVFTALLAAVDGVQKVVFVAATPRLVDLYRDDLTQALARLGERAPNLDITVDWTPWWLRLVRGAATVTIRPTGTM